MAPQGSRRPARGPGEGAQPREVSRAVPGGALSARAGRVPPERRGGGDRGRSGTPAPRSLHRRRGDPEPGAIPRLPTRHAGEREATMIRRLDHVAVAVRKVEERLGLYRDLLGLPLERIEEVPGE